MLLDRQPASCVSSSSLHANGGLLARPASSAALRRSHQRCGRQRQAVVVTAEEKRQKNLINPLAYSAPSEGEIRLRSEAEAPFRVARLVFFGFNAVSASVATLVATSQLIASLAGGPNAMPLEGTAQTLAIDVAAVALFAFLFSRDKKAQEKQIARITREERLGALQLELANKRTLRMAQLRSFARPVILAGTAEQVAEALAAAEPFREALVERGVLIVPVPCYEPDGRGSASLPPPAAEDLRWRVTPLRMAAWADWFSEQLKLTGKTSETGLYVGLRMDGRVRASGRGIPPWAVFAAQLPPASGMWTGFMDGFDGAVRSFD